MNKTKIIQEAIDDLLKIRQKRYDEYISALTEQDWALDALNDGAIGFTLDFEEKKSENQIWNEFVTDFDLPLVKLNNLLNRENQNDEVLEIEKNMAKLHGKKYLSVEEFEDKYNISKSSQTQYRGRMHNSLPYHQIVEKGKITYVVEEVEQWFQNQHK
jgi:hypothetical protein